MLTITSVVLGGILILLAVLLAWSYPGKPKPFVDQNGHPLAGSISEKIYLNINGVEQGMFIKGKDVNNPVLLYLHGGMPDYFLTEKYPTGLEDYFTVVWWEQRGSGMSYSPSILPETMTLEQMISDTLALTNYLRQRFGKEKIYLMGHSGGTFIGIQTAARSPELYNAYIGVAQMSNQLKSEKLVYDYMLDQFKANGNTNMVRKLEAAPVTMTSGTPDAYRALRDPAMHSLGIGTTHDMNSVFTGIFLPSLQNHDYTLSEKIDMWRGKATSGIVSLWDEMITTDLSEQVVELHLPVYFFPAYTITPATIRWQRIILRNCTRQSKDFTHSSIQPTFHFLKNRIKRSKSCGRTYWQERITLPTAEADDCPVCNDFVAGFFLLLQHKDRMENLAFSQIPWLSVPQRRA